MVDHLDAVARACDARARIDEWTINRTRERRAVQSTGARPERLLGTTTRSRVHVFRDMRRGRGTAWFDLHTGDELGSALSGAVSRARHNQGPPWRLPPPAAPARVSVADAGAFGDPEGEAARVAEDLRRAAKPIGALTSVEVDVAARMTDVRTSGGFAARYRATAIRYRATLVATDGAVEVLRGFARRRADLDLPGAMAETARRLQGRAQAALPGTGRYDVVLSGAARVGPSSAAGPGDYGWWLPLVAQSSATLARQGLSRYRIGQSIYGDAAPTGDRLSLRSDGTLPFAPYSAPFGDRGEPVRAFDLIRDGIAVGHPLDAAEAGMRDTAPNGGARNLVIGAGVTLSKALERPTERPLLSVTDLTWLDVDPRTGAVVADIALGSLDVGGTRQTVRGGSIRGNIFDMLARARFSREVEARDWLVGPRVIRLSDVEVA